MRCIIAQATICRSIDPLDLLAFAPESLSLNVLFVLVSTPTVLFAIFPITSIRSAIRPYEFSVSLLLVHNVFTLIFPSVRPDENALPIHFIIPPNAFVLALVSPLVVPKSLNIVDLELSVVLTTIAPNEFAMTMLQPINKIPFITSSVNPSLYTITMLFVVEPFTSV
jgi:hypothetical protein